MKILPIICGLLLITGCAIGGSLPVSPPQIVTSPTTLTVTNVDGTLCAAFYLPDTAPDFALEAGSTNWVGLGTNDLVESGSLVSNFTITNVPTGSLLTAESGDGINWSTGNPTLLLTNTVTFTPKVIAPPVIGDK
jgi:hypothetical protein